MISRDEKIDNFTKRLFTDIPQESKSIRDFYFTDSILYMVDVVQGYLSLKIYNGAFHPIDTIEYDNIYRANTIIKSKINNRVYVGDLNGLQVNDLDSGLGFLPDFLFIGLRIEDIIEDESGQLILATKGRGISVYIPWNASVAFIDDGQGLLDNYVEDIEYQGDNIYWVATLKGVSKVDIIDMSSLKVKNYTVSHGLAVPDGVIK